MTEGDTEVAVLPSVGNLRWKDGDSEIVPERWRITRMSDDGSKLTATIEATTTFEATPIPMDGDVIAFEGRGRVIGKGRPPVVRPPAPTPAPTSPRRRVVIPPPSSR